jgi:F-type H+-transporting ATPase subunit delta
MKAADVILSKRYARAYLDLDGRAFDKRGDAAARAGIAELEGVRNALSQFRRLFLHPLVGYDDKNEVAARLLPKALMVSRAAGFARLLIRENRFYLLEAVIEDCMRQYNVYSGQVRADAVSRYPMSAEEMQRVGGMLSSATGKKVHVAQIVSERVVGGLELRLGDLLVDATIKGRLEKLRKSVLAR